MSATLDVNHLLVTGNVTEVISRERNQGVLLVLTSSSFTQGSVDLLLTYVSRDFLILVPRLKKLK